MPNRSARRKLAPRTDLGPAVQHEADRPEHAPRLEVVYAPDPARPDRIVKRARRVWLYDQAHRAGQITDAEREACDRYAVLCEREAGAQERHDGPSSRAEPWARSPGLTAVQAAATLRAAHSAVGLDGAALLRLYVRDNLPAKEIAERRKERETVTLGRIRAAITRLAEHWGIE